MKTTEKSTRLLYCRDRCTLEVFGFGRKVVSRNLIFHVLLKKKNAGLFLITKNKSFEFGKTRCILDAVVCLIFLYFLNFFPFSSLSFSFPRILSLHTCKNSTSCSLFCVSIFLSQSHTPLFPKERVCVSLCCEANKGYLLSCKSVCVGWSRE